ncbi:hypothetical protein SCLO_1010920 [Sphingobium cloacae]|uniref:Uncharacterized protein n=1 Tax=Sphingobium cloacae TaxID=120107 RepID=A0A1E1F0Z9_9SPHN|nr:hypothetical protein SCLO_1010920 [Sphingobium cloacae]
MATRLVDLPGHRQEDDFQECRKAIEQVRRVLPVSERWTCRVLVQHRSTQRRRPKDDAEEQRLTADIVALAKETDAPCSKRLEIHLAVYVCKWVADLLDGMTTLGRKPSHPLERHHTPLTPQTPR